MKARVAASVVLIAELMSPSPSIAAQPDQDYAVTGGWRYERFGTDVLVLRAALSFPARPQERAGRMLLSCDGEAQQIHVEFPVSVVKGATAHASGRMLVRGYGSAGGLRAAVSTFGLERGRSLTLGGTPGQRASVLRGVVRLLSRRPASLDLLLTLDAGVQGLGTGIPIHVRLEPRAQDDPIFDAFASGCHLGPAEQGDNPSAR